MLRNQKFEESEPLRNHFPENEEGDNEMWESEGNGKARHDPEISMTDAN
jgi:hypothetical protein